MMRRQHWQQTFGTYNDNIGHLGFEAIEVSAIFAIEQASEIVRQHSTDTNMVSGVATKEQRRLAYD
ncbi:hypothetical protein EIP86_009727, partial [Pleurotus ostreatoroseus]